MNIKRLLEATRNGAIDAWASSVLWKSAPSPPPSPDYLGAAKAQGAANVDTAIAEGVLNRPNQITPYGTLNYNQTGSYTTPSGQEVPRFTSEVNLTPEGLQRFNQEQRISTGLGNIAEQGIDRVGAQLGTPFNMGAIPPQAKASEQARQAVADALYGRMQPQLQRQREQGENALLVGGFNPGGEAWKARQDDMARAENDARLAAQIQAGSEQSRLYGLESDARNKAIQEQAYLRSLPLNEINALRSGSQVQMPQFQGQGNQNIAPAPIFDATQAGYGAQLNNYNAEVGAANAANAGLYSLGAAGLGMFRFSDSRLKSDVVRIGTHPLGIGIYEYTIFGNRERGVMAQEVLNIKPEAVAVHDSGYLMVDYGSL